MVAILDTVRPQSSNSTKGFRTRHIAEGRMSIGVSILEDAEQWVWSTYKEMLLASATMNGVALIALGAVVAGVDHPDAALSALGSPILIFTTGMVAGACGLFFLPDLATLLIDTHLNLKEVDSIETDLNESRKQQATIEAGLRAFDLKVGEEILPENLASMRREIVEDLSISAKNIVGFSERLNKVRDRSVSERGKIKSMLEKLKIFPAASIAIFMLGVVYIVGLSAGGHLKLEGDSSREERASTSSK